MDADPIAIDIICFPGAPNLPIFAAQEKGFFADAGVTVTHTTTPSSSYQAENLVAGTFQIAGTAFDNVVAYRENQGVISFDEAPDLFAFMGATQIELALIAAPDVAGFEDLKGRSLALDALNTGFAFVLYEMLRRAGLSVEDCPRVPVGATPDRWESVKSGEHAATLTIEPFTSIARAQGFNVLATSTALFDAYQGGVFAASRAWAAANADAVKGYIQGYLAGLRWTLDPANGEEASALLLTKMPAIKPAVAGKVMASLLSPESGLTPNGAIIDQGVAEVLALRSEFGGGTPLTDPTRYIDLTYWREVTGG